MKNSEGENFLDSTAMNVASCSSVLQDIGLEALHSGNSMYDVLW